MKFRYGRVAGVIAIAGLLLIGFLLISGGGAKKPSVPVNKTKLLHEYASGSATVSATTKGAINAQEAHREIKVTVGKSSRVIKIIRGYNGEVIKSKSYPNSQNAYSEFLYALEYAGFTNERSNSIKNEQGVCALGNRYVFKLEQKGKDISRLWTSTCSGAARGTFNGSTAQVLALFEAQITDYDRLTQRVNLR